MSSVVIAGDTSGSVTLNAQAVSGTTVLTLPNTSGTVALTGNNQVQTQLFTAPGTWTNPGSVTQVKVTVIGGGGGTNAGTPGGTSSFGPAVSATGGTTSGGPVAAADGTGTVAVGTEIKTGSVTGIQESVGTAPAIVNSQFISFGSLYGRAINNSYAGSAGPSPGVAYSTSLVVMAGAGGGRPGSVPGVGGGGGLAQAIVPVSAPVTITVGSGGTAGPALPGAHRPGIGGAVLVEWIG